MSETFSNFNEKTYRLIRGLRRTNPEEDPLFFNNEVEPRKPRRKILVPVYENPILAHCIKYGEFWYRQVTGHEIIWLDDDKQTDHNEADAKDDNVREHHDASVDHDLDAGAVDLDAGACDLNVGRGDSDVSAPDAGNSNIGAAGGDLDTFVDTAGDLDADTGDGKQCADTGLDNGGGDRDAGDVDTGGGDEDTGASDLCVDASDQDSVADDLLTYGGKTKSGISKNHTYTYDDYCMYTNYDRYQRKSVSIPGVYDLEASSPTRFGITGGSSDVNRDYCKYKKNDTYSSRKDVKKHGGNASCKRDIRQQYAGQFSQYHERTYRLLRGLRRTDPEMNPDFAERKQRLPSKRP